MSSNPVSPKKLLHSKWTACLPTDKEKHFLVTAVHVHEQPHRYEVFAVAHEGDGWPEFQIYALELRLGQRLIDLP